MSKVQLNNIKAFFENKRNRERLIQLMKAGNYVEFVEDLGFIYAIKIGEMEGMDLMLRVSMLAGEFQIHDAFLQAIPGVEKELVIA